MADYSKKAQMFQHKDQGKKIGTDDIKKLASKVKLSDVREAGAALKKQAAKKDDDATQKNARERTRGGQAR